MVVEMLSSGTGAVARIEVQNLNTANLAFETHITRMDYNPDGTITETPADEDFLVFPPQGVLPTGGRQVIRVQWVGAPDIPASRAYYLSVNQLPVTLDPTDPAQVGGQVQIVYHMKALIVVAPPGATPNVEATAARPIDYQPAPETEGGPLPPKVPGVAITLRNTGRRHALMSGLRWVVEGTGTNGQAVSHIFTQGDLNRLIGTAYVPPLTGERTFQLPVPAAFGPGPIRVRFVR
jgi:fimbrial chaperone protein